MPAVLPTPMICMNVVLPAWRSSEPTVSRPGLLPGEIVPPASTVTSDAIVPLPPSVARFSTVTSEFASEPLMTSVPPETVVAPV